MKKTHFENPEIYRSSEKLSDEVWEIVSGWSLPAQQTIGAQIARAADGIGAIISEVSDRGGNDYVRFLRTSRGSLYETRRRPRRAYKREPPSHERVRTLTASLEKPTPMLNALYPLDRNLPVDRRRAYIKDNENRKPPYLCTLKH